MLCLARHPRPFLWTFSAVLHVPHPKSDADLGRQTELAIHLSKVKRRLSKLSLYLPFPSKGHLDLAASMRASKCSELLPPYFYVLVSSCVFQADFFLPPL